MASAISTIFFILFIVSLLPAATSVSLKGVRAFRERETLSTASNAVNAVLKATSHNQSSVILITDGSTSSATIREVISELATQKGVSVFEAVSHVQELNQSIGQLYYVIKEARKMRESSWYVTVVVASDDPEFLATFAMACYESTLIIWSSKLLLVTAVEKAELQSLLEQHWVLYMMNTMAIQVTESSGGDNSKCKVYSQLPYTPDGKSNLVQVATWTVQHGLTLSSRYQLFPQKYKNFYGSKINVTMWPFMPYFTTLEEVTGDSDLAETYTGRDYLMLETIANVLNFTVYRIPCASWNEVLLKVIEGISFISPMKLSVLPHLLEVIDYTITYEPESASFAMKKPSRKPRWQSLYYPLTNDVWASILAVLLLVPVFLFWIVRYGIPEQPNSWTGPWVVVVQDVEGILLGQSVLLHLPTTNPVRILILAWIIFSLIIGTVYRGNLTAFLTIPKYPARVETLHQFLDAGASLLMPPDAVDFYNSFKQSPPGDYKKLSEQTYFVPNISVGFARVAKENVGYMYERRNMELNIARYYTKPNGWTPFYVAKENLWPGWSGWPIIKGAPYKPVLDRYIRQISEAGLLEKWGKDVTDLFKRATRDKCIQNVEYGYTDVKDCEVSPFENAEVGDLDILDLGDGSDEEGGMKPLTIAHLQGPLLLFVFCLLICVISFISEVCSSKRFLPREVKIK